MNAFALPTGRIYVTRGLLALADDTSELAAVLAHEIAHVTLRHASARTEMALRSELVSKVVADVLNDPATGAPLAGPVPLRAGPLLAHPGIRGRPDRGTHVGPRGYDPFGASRFLTALNRTTALRAGSGLNSEPDMLATHPSTPERITQVTQAARRIGAPGLGVDDRNRYLAAIDGIAYGDNPADGLIRGRRFIHPRLGVAFEAPEGFGLDNTARAVLGTTPDGKSRLLFDAVETNAGQGLEEVLKATWNDAIETGSFENRMLNGFPAVTAVSKGKEWFFRLAAVRVGSNTFRMIMAAKGATDPEPAFGRWLASIALVTPEEARSLKPLRIQVVTAAAGDTVESLAQRMTAVDRPLERFQVLNGLDKACRCAPAALQAGGRVGRGNGAIRAVAPLLNPDRPCYLGSRRGCSSMVEQQPSKLNTRVRFLHPLQLPPLQSKGVD